MSDEMEENKQTEQTENIETKEQSGVLVYVLFSLLLIAFGLIAYGYLSYDMVNKGDLQTKYTKTDDINFNMLPSYEQDDYVEKSQIDKLNTKIRELSDKIKNQQNLEVKVVEKIVEIEKPIEVEKIVEVEKEIIKNIPVIQKINKAKFEIFRGYNTAEDSVYPTKDTINKLHTFLDKNKDAKAFEVIGVVNMSDFAIKDKVIKAIDNKDRVEKLFKLAELGLSRKRVVEGTWEIRKYLGDDANIQVVNYTITSKKNNKGFVVRAYK